MFTQGQLRLAINKAGNVGIGTESPQHKLDVDGTTRLIGNLYLGKQESPSNGGEINRISIIPYRHTGGPWNIISRDTPSQAYLDIAYSKYKAMSITYFNGDAKIGIGTEYPQNKLDVAGTIRATEVRVETGWADFVFDKDYKLPTLREVENHINQYKHLPDIPSEKEVKENGISLGEMQAKLLQKIEELTLYVIAQDKKLETQSDKLKEVEQENKELRRLLLAE